MSEPDRSREPERQASPSSARPRDPGAAGPGRAGGTTPPAGGGRGADGAAAGGPVTADTAGPGMPGHTAGDDADLTARMADLKDQRLRALADLDNLRKRCAAQVRTAEADAVARVAAQWLPVVDNLERALAHAQADPGSIIEGVRAVRDQATGVLTQLGFPRREDLGATFDPARHEAVAARPDPAAPDGSVIEVVRPAYGEDERQLRPAQVVVAKAD